ncbi:MAG: hypothetical protein L0207_02460 [Chlamydiae bacterium]|nr:hypothetical protein [Chlamydiota bacterium]
MEVEKPGDSAAYRAEVKRGVQIFEKDFKGIQTSKFLEQKEQYEKSANESLEAIQDAVSALMNKELMKLKDKLAQDYQNYLDNPTDQNRNKVQRDIDNLKHSA